MSTETPQCVSFEPWIFRHSHESVVIFPRVVATFQGVENLAASFPRDEVCGIERQCSVYFVESFAVAPHL